MFLILLAWIDTSSGAVEEVEDEVEVNPMDVEDVGPVMLGLSHEVERSF